MAPANNEKNNVMEARASELYRYFELLVYQYMVVQSDCLSTPIGTLSHQEEKVITIVGQRGDCIMREIAETLRLAMSTVTGIVDRLVQKGLVCRDRSESDRRIVQVSLTGSGKDAYLRAHNKFMEMCRGILNSLEPVEQEQLLALIRKTLPAP